VQIAKSTLMFCCLLSITILPNAQIVVSPQVRTKSSGDGKVDVVEIGAHFVSAIRLPEPVNSIAVGDPALFQVEHSDREPDLVLVKALTERNSETNLLVSTIRGRQFSFLLLNRGSAATLPKVDFLLQYKRSASFLVEPQVVPFALVGQIMPVAKVESPASSKAKTTLMPSFVPTVFSMTTTETTNLDVETTRTPAQDALDDLLQRQQAASLPGLYGEPIESKDIKGDQLRVGISEVLDGDDLVTVLFSVVNNSKHAILLMPPQVQLGGKSRTGKLLKHEHWSTAEQLPVTDFRLSRRRVGAGERADGVVVFERPPYKQSTEQLFLQIAESGAVDRPALAPIGFGVSSLRQEEDHGMRGTRN